MAAKRKSEEEQRRLRSLFYAYDADNSGRIEKNEFSTICQELHVPLQQVEDIFNHLDVNKDGTVTLEEFISGFKDQYKDEEGEDETSATAEAFSVNKEQVISR